MGQVRIWTSVVVVGLLTAAGLFAQQAAPGNASAVAGSVPRLVKFSGTLAGRQGEALGGVASRLSFSIYEGQAGGAALWSEVQDVRPDAQGRYSVLLGAGSSDGLPAELFSTGGPRWLGVQIEGRQEDSRVLLVAVPYALKAADADTLGGKPATAYVASDQLKDQVQSVVQAQAAQSGSATRTLIGTAPTPQAIGEPPSSFVCAVGTDCVAVTQSGAGAGLHATTPTGTSVLGELSGTTGAAVYGRATAGTGAASAVQGDSAAPNGVGVLGRAFGTTGTAKGVFGRSFSTSGTGVHGDATATTGATRGVYGTSVSTGGVGVYGQSAAATGFTTGVSGTVASNSGVAVYGLAGATSGSTIGVQAKVSSLLGTAIVADNTTGGKIFSGRYNGAETISMDGGGHLVATTTSGTPISGVTTDGPAVSGSSSGSASGVYGTGADSGVRGNGDNVGVWGTGLTGVYGSGTNYGVYGTSANYGMWGTGATGVYGNGTVIGLYGNGGSNGVLGLTNSGSGVVGQSTSGSGVAGISTDDVGIVGSSTNGIGGSFHVENTSGKILRGTSGAGSDEVFTVLGNGSVGIRAAADPQSSLRVDRAGTENTDNYGLYVSNATTNSASSIVRAGLRVRSSGAVVTISGHGALVENLTTNATTDGATKYGLYVAATGAFAGLGGTATRNYALYVAIPAGADENYGAYIGGSVGIGTSAPVQKLQVVGDVRIGASGTLGCLQRFDGASLAGACSSDLRLKKNIQPFSPVLDKLAQLQPVRFNWRAAEFPAYHFGGARISGLIAQDVEKVFPELVAEDERGYKTVNYSDLPVLMLQGIRELKAENDSLRAQLKTQLQTQATELAELRAIVKQLAAERPLVASSRH